MKALYHFLFLAANVAVIVFFWWHGSVGQVSWAIALGRLAGLLAMFMLMLQLVTIGRIPWLERAYGHDQLNRIHRAIGYSIGFLLIAHPTLLALGYGASSIISISTQFVALSIFSFVIIFTITMRKRVRYETWHFTHMLVYVAIVLVFQHQVAIGGDFAYQPFVIYWYALVFGVGGVFVIFRWLRPLYRSWRHQFVVERVVAENHDVHSVYITGRDLDRFRFEPGQFANLWFIQRGLWFSHPFSFSDSNQIRFTMKNCGDFTARIGEIKPGTSVIIDGPLGVFVKRRARTNKFLYIAGGIGITPIRALIKKEDAVLLYSARTADDLVFKKDFDALIARRHYFTSERITKEKIAELVPDVRDRDAYLCGPPPMMDAMIAILRSLGVPSSQIHFEKFSY